MFKGVYEKEPKSKAGTIRIDVAEIVCLEIKLHEKLVGNDDYIALTVRFRERPNEYFFTESASVTERKSIIDLGAVINFFNINLPNIPIVRDRSLPEELL